MARVFQIWGEDVDSDEGGFGLITGDQGSCQKQVGGGNEGTRAKVKKWKEQFPTSNTPSLANSARA